MERDDGPGIKGEGPKMFTQITFPTFSRVSKECFSTIPREELLMAVYVSVESGPVEPILVQRVDQVGPVRASKPESTEIILRQPVWDISGALRGGEGGLCEYAGATKETNSI
jgi:hypothetical protein